MPQQNYNIDRVAALAGQVTSQETVVGRYQAVEAIPPGRVVELDGNGKVQLFRGTGKRIGVSMYRDTHAVSDAGDGSWQIDEFVPVLREGVIYMEFVGTEANIADLTDVNVSGKDTTATDRGKATDAGLSSAADAEVYEVPGLKYAGTPVASTTSEGDAQKVVLVEVDMTAKRDRLAPVMLTQAANDFAVPATARDGQMFEIGTTAAASTVSLPASLPDGMVLNFFADGTKNGHTLTFRDVATAISAATTASKRVAGTAMKQAGKWAINLTVGP